MISIIVAKAENNAIGKDNSLLWHISADLKYFKKVTTGHAVIMGYNTFRSIGEKPLPGRRNIVVSRRHGPVEDCGVEFAGTIEDAVNAVQAAGEKEAFIIGGGQIYRTSLPLADRLYITEVHTVIGDADTFFPEIDMSVWKEEYRSERMTDDKSGYDYSFVTYTRR